MNEGRPDVSMVEMKKLAPALRKCMEKIEGAKAAPEMELVDDFRVYYDTAMIFRTPRGKETLYNFIVCVRETCQKPGKYIEDIWFATEAEKPDDDETFPYGTKLGGEEFEEMKKFFAPVLDTVVKRGEFR